MSFRTRLIFIQCLFIFFVSAAIHEEIPQCGLTGVYKTRQTVLESPNYPDNYPPNTCWDYVLRSPYRCPTKFHIQFLDFYLESSQNCTNDYLAVGLENDEEDMDVLCGQVIGIKKYHTPDGVLRLRFYSDDSPWTTGKGFKLLVTRLACEREEMLRDILVPSDQDTEQVNAPSYHLKPPDTNLPELFRNLSLQDQYRPYPVPPLFGLNLPSQLPAPPYPGFGGFYVPVTQRPSTSQSGSDEKPCTPANTALHGFNNHQLPIFTRPYVPNTLPTPPLFRTDESQTRQSTGTRPAPTLADPCCTSPFNQKRFYLSSPGFPGTAFTSLLPTQQRDCQFHLEKSSPAVCRLRIDFKFYDFGQTYSGTGAISTRDVCTEDFLEIDGERFCGCRTGYKYTTVWRLGEKALRMRMGYAGIPSSGFLLDISQEECDATQSIDTQLPVQGTGFAGFGIQQQPIAGVQQPIFGQQQQQQQQTSFIHQSSQQLLPSFLQQQQQHQQQQPYQLSVYPQFFHQLQDPYRNYQNNAQYWMLSGQNRYPLQVPQFRQGRGLESVRSASSQQPVTVVETNSTRKEYYYFDGDEVLARSRPLDEPDDPQRVGVKPLPTQRSQCSFDTGDALRLTIDSLWLTRPACYTPIRRFFSNIFG